MINLAVEEFQINSTTSDTQRDPSVTELSTGGYVVTWTSNNQDGSGLGVYGQRYGVNGEALGDEFQINTEAEGTQERSSAIGLSDGGFFVEIGRAHV